MPTDNSRHLHAAQQHHHDELVHRVERTLRRIERAGTPATFPSVAIAAGVSRAFIYKTPALRAGVERLRQTNQPSASHPVPARQRRSDASKDAVIVRLQHDNRDLREHNQQLAEQNAALLGRLRAARQSPSQP
jgi:hypothetical protein